MAKVTDAHDLDLNLLRVFAVVAEEGSITRAATRLYVTQPAVSASLRRLATFVGTDLFVRQGRGVVLSTRGQELLAATRTHLAPLVAAAVSPPIFDPMTQAATVRLGLGDSFESIVLPPLLARLGTVAPMLSLVVVPVQFRSVGPLLLDGKVDVALSVADELPRSILREPWAEHANEGFACLYDARHARLPKRLDLESYFAHEHAIVSYAGDLRGYVEDALGQSRRVRVSLPSLGFVADAIDGTAMLATVPVLLARHLVKVRPHFAMRALPFVLEPAPLELLWPRTHDADDLMRFVRQLVRDSARAVGTHRRK